MLSKDMVGKDDLKQAHIIVSGMVQGVSFRYHTAQKAKELCLPGWVKNTADGNVEITIEGKEIMLKEFIDWCRRGPPFSRVEKVVVEWKEPTQMFSSFNILS